MPGIDPPWHYLKHYFRLNFDHLPSNRLVAKLTSVPRTAVSTVCSTSPSEMLAQMEQSVPPIVEIRISFSFIPIPPFLQDDITLITFGFRPIQLFWRWLILF